MPISQQEQNKSVEFTNALNNILFIVENLLDKIDEKAYLDICNNLKVLNDNKETNVIQVIEQVRRNPIVETHNRRTRLTVIDRSKHLIKKEICPYCDTEVKHIKLHMKTAKCLHIQRTKKLSALSQKLNTSDIYFMTEKLRGMGRVGLVHYLLSCWRENYLCEYENPFDEL
tara:strand:+ start:68 stop:580 length:513 start_codon:yes stop_codon:yes gene_type:complete